MRRQGRSRGRYGEVVLAVGAIEVKKHSRLAREGCSQWRARAVCLEEGKVVEKVSARERNGRMKGERRSECEGERLARRT